MYPLLKLTNTTLTKAEFNKLLPVMRKKGYRCLGVFHDGTLIAITGFWVGVRFWCRKYIDIDNVVVVEKWRRHNIGKRMMAWIENEGRKQRCNMAVLDCYTTFHQAHRFYHREGYSILGYHFTKDL